VDRTQVDLPCNKLYGTHISSSFEPATTCLVKPKFHLAVTLCHDTVRLFL